MEVYISSSARERPSINVVGDKKDSPEKVAQAYLAVKSLLRKAVVQKEKE